jgi:hypothetical protein
VHVQHLAESLAGREARIERPRRILENDLHPPAHGPQRGAARCRDVLSFEGDAAAGRFEKPHDEPRQRRLAATGFADQAEPFPRCDVEIDAGDGVQDVVARVPDHAALRTDGAVRSPTAVHGSWSLPQFGEAGDLVSAATSRGCGSSRVQTSSA